MLQGGFMKRLVMLGLVVLASSVATACVIRVSGRVDGAATNSSVPVKTCPDLDPNTTVTYDFNGLSEGNLEGQDGWTVVDGKNPMTIKEGQGFDGSKAAVFAAFGQIIRKNQNGFSIPRISGTETTLAIEYDTLYAGMAEGGTSEFMLVSSATMTGKLKETSTSPWVGLKSGQLNYREASMGTQFAAPVPSDVKPGHWLRLRLVIDLTDKTEGKNGSASVFLKNLSKKDTVFRSIPSLYNRDAHLERMSAPSTSWDAVYIRFDRPANYHIDNLRVSPAANCK